MDPMFDISFSETEHDSLLLETLLTLDPQADGFFGEEFVTFEISFSGRRKLMINFYLPMQAAS